MFPPKKICSKICMRVCNLDFKAQYYCTSFSILYLFYVFYFYCIDFNKEFNFHLIFKITSFQIHGETARKFLPCNNEFSD